MEGSTRQEKEIAPGLSVEGAWADDQPKVYLFTPDLRKNFDDTKSGYPSFRRMIEDRLAKAGLQEAQERLEKLDDIFKKYRESDVVLTRADGKKQKRWNITTLRGQLLQILNLQDLHDGTKSESIKDLEDEIKEGVRAVRWRKKIGLSSEDDEAILHEKKQYLQIMKAMRDGSYSHLVPGPKRKIGEGEEVISSAYTIRPTREEARLKEQRWKRERNRDYRRTVRGLALMLKVLSGASSLDGPMMEAGELLHAIGAVDKGKNPGRNVKKLFYSKGH